MQGAKRPVPPPTSITKAYWERAKQGVFVLPYCRACGTYTYYPRSVCMRCLSRDLEWREASGRGTIYSFAIVRHPAPGFEGAVPYVIVSVDLEEGTRMMANLLTDDLDSVRIGLPVQVTFEELTPDIHLPQFIPATGG